MSWFIFKLSFVYNFSFKICRVVFDKNESTLALTLAYRSGKPHLTDLTLEKECSQGRNEVD